MSNDLGSRLRAHRKKHGLTQGDVAQTLGLSVSYISDIERGRRGIPPVMQTMQAIEALIGVAPQTEVGWRTTASALDAECARLAAENQRLRAVVGALSTDKVNGVTEPATFYNRGGDWECVFCAACANDITKFKHAADCAILAGRALL